MCPYKKKRKYLTTVKLRKRKVQKVTFNYNKKKNNLILS